MSETERREKWKRANPEKHREAQRRWRLKNKAACAARMREWRRNNADHHRAWVRSNREKIRARAVARRKTPVGRVCRDCGRDDSQTTWGSIKNQCASCTARERYNGRCPDCEAIRVRVRTVYGAASKGVPGKKICPDRCRSAKRLGSIVLRTWDALRWNGRDALTIKELAEAFRWSTRHIERSKSKILDVVKAHDPAARWESVPGRADLLVFRPDRVVAGLERVVMESA